MNQEKKIFQVKDCTLIVRMGGVYPAMNLREFRERIAVCPLESLYHHFCETLIRPTFDDPEFRNDFSVWASKYLRDRILAERLGAINPYAFDNLEQLRERLLETIDDRLDELPNIPWVERGEEFRFLRAATIVFDTGLVFENPTDLVKHLPDVSSSSLYYHFIEARRRTENGIDDFTAWMQEFDPVPTELIKTLSNIDFYFLNLVDLKTALHMALTTSKEKDAAR